MYYNNKEMKLLKKVLKVIIAGVIAILLLSLILCFYSITPIHKTNVNNNTDYIWTPNSYWVNMTEGISFGQYDSNGYNNLEVIENPDIIMVGSSHIEANYLNQDENVVSLLNDMFENMSVYNLGISGHDFYKCCQYLETNMQLYDSAKYVIIETTDLDIDSDDVYKIKNHEIKKTVSYENGLMVTLQKIPFFRVAYQQLTHGLDEILLGKSQDSQSITNNAVSIDEEAYESLFAYLEALETNYNKQIIIIYHPTESINEDSTLSFTKNGYLDSFIEYSKKHNIDFINLENDIIDLYNNDHQLAHGFINTKLAYGHLNKYGHKIMANAIYKKIIEVENSCQ